MIPPVAWKLREVVHDAWLRYVVAALPAACVCLLVRCRLLQEHRVFCGIDARSAFYFYRGQRRWVYPKPDPGERMSGPRGMDDLYPNCLSILTSQPIQVSKTRAAGYTNGKGAAPVLIEESAVRFVAEQGVL